MPFYSPCLKRGRPLTIYIATVRSSSCKLLLGAQWPDRTDRTAACEIDRSIIGVNASNSRSWQKPREESVALSVRAEWRAANGTLRSLRFSPGQAGLRMIKVDPFNRNNCFFLKSENRRLHRLPRSANHFRDFFMCERQFPDAQALPRSPRWATTRVVALRTSSKVNSVSNPVT